VDKAGVKDSIRDLVADSILHVVEIFPSVEGEGLMIGVPTAFVRLFGCNVGCLTCDTPESWHPEFKVNAQEIATRDIFLTLMDLAYGVGRDTNSQKLKRVSITGGEPMLFPEEIYWLAVRLQACGLVVNLETSGTVFNTDVFGTVDTVSMDIKTPSSGHELNQNNIRTINEIYSRCRNLYLKAVVKDQEDLDFLLDNFGPILHSAPMKSIGRPLVLTPCVEMLDISPQSKCYEVQELILNWNKGYNIAIIAQQHKLLSYR
jgi:7-carboxy-7-deazaguanine synthase